MKTIEELRGKTLPELWDSDLKLIWDRINELEISLQKQTKLVEKYKNALINIGGGNGDPWTAVGSKIEIQNLARKVLFE